MAQNGDSAPEALTVDSAALAIEAALSDDDLEEQADDDAPPEGDKPKATDDDEEETAPVDDEEASDDEVDPEDDTETPALHKVTVDGVETEVTLDEALKGYSRTQDYTRKTQKHADEVRTFEAERTAVRAERQATVSKLAELDTTLSTLVQEPDWDKLESEDPASLARVHAAWQIHEKRITKIRTDRAAIEQRMNDDAAAQYSEHLVSEQAKLADAIPEWKDATISKKEKADLIDYAATAGFSSDELDNVADHRAIVLLRKAMKYDESLKKKADVKTVAQGKIDKVRVAAPGSPKAKTPKGTELVRRKVAAQKSGTTRDAAKAIESMLGDI